MPQQLRLTPEQARTMPLETVAQFLEQGREVDQPHLRSALVSALRHIARLESELGEVQAAVCKLESR